MCQGMNTTGDVVGKDRGKSEGQSDNATLLNAGIAMGNVIIARVGSGESNMKNRTNKILTGNPIAPNPSSRGKKSLKP